VKFHELSDDSLADLLPVAKKVALALGVKDYNILQNNGIQSMPTIPNIRPHCPSSCGSRSLSRKTPVFTELMSQIIPKPDQEEGLGVGWPAKEANQGELKALLEEIKGKL
jgi:diadenosine tetraphosphate (Ap4A) HIT family hydrolase